MHHGDMTGASPGARLRQLLDGGELVVAPGIFDGLSAHLVRRMGFRAGYLTGAGVAASGFGLPDIGLAGMAEMTVAIYPTTALLAAANAAIGALRGLGGSATPDALGEPIATMEDFFRIVGLDEWSAVSERWHAE
jgi:2-methylisocitrate lyase-like PEP mutase family enzyme